MKTGSISSYTDLDLALMILLGYFGNGDSRKKALGSRYTKAQAIVDRILNTNTVPAGSGSSAITKTAVQAAVKAALNETVNDLANDIIGKVKL